MTSDKATTDTTPAARFKGALKAAAQAALAAVLAAALCPAPALAGGGLVAAPPQAATAQGAPKQAQAAAKKRTAIAAKMVTARNLAYTGKAQAAKVTVKAGKRTLKAGRDYTLRVTDARGGKVAGNKPRAVGTYKASVKGKGAYKGAVTKSFRVAKAISRCKVTASSLKWTGAAQAAKVAVRDGSGKALAAGRDYTLRVTDARGRAVSKPKAAGAYTATVTGKGAWAGTAKAKFKVWSKDGRKWVRSSRLVDVVERVEVVDDPGGTYPKVVSRDAGTICVWGDRDFWTTRDDPYTIYYPVKYVNDPWHLEYNGGKEVPVAVHTDQTDPEVHKVVLPWWVREGMKLDYMDMGYGEEEAARLADDDPYAPSIFRSGFRAYFGEMRWQRERGDAGWTDEQVVAWVRENGACNDRVGATRDEQADDIAALLPDLRAFRSAGHVCMKDGIGVFEEMGTVTYPKVSHYEDKVVATKVVCEWGWSEERYL